jgi:hypothetical protein
VQFGHDRLFGGIAGGVCVHRSGRPGNGQSGGIRLIRANCWDGEPLLAA